MVKTRASHCLIANDHGPIRDAWRRDVRGSLVRGSMRGSIIGRAVCPAISPAIPVFGTKPTYFYQVTTLMTTGSRNSNFIDLSET